MAFLGFEAIIDALVGTVATDEIVGAASEIELTTLTEQSSSILGDEIATTSFSTSETYGSIASPETATQTSTEFLTAIDSSSTETIASENQVAAAQIFAEQQRFSTPVMMEEQEMETFWTDIDLSPIAENEEEEDILFSRLDGEVEDLQFRQPSANLNFLRSSFTRTPMNITLLSPTSTSILGVSLVGGGIAATVIGSSSTTAAAGISVMGGTATAVGGLTSKILTALPFATVAGGTAATVVYQVVQTMEDLLPGSVEYLNNLIDKGKTQISEDNALNWISLLMENSSVLANLKMSGTDLALMPNGDIVKVGSAIAKSLKTNNLVESVWHGAKTVIPRLMKASPLMRNLNSDIVQQRWQASTLL